MATATKAPKGYVRFDWTLLQTETVVDFDLYIWSDGGRPPVLYRNGNLPFLDDQRERLLDLGTSEILTRSEHAATVNRYVERNLDRIISNPDLPIKMKARILYRTSLQMAKELLEKPDAPDNLRRSEDIVRATIGYIVQGKEAFQQLLSITSYDYYTYTHSVNVCAMGLALAEAAGMRSQTELMEFGVGALFHDVGKTQISPAILRKRGPLTSEEWVLMRRHPEIGLELIDPNAPFSRESKAVILEHHERMDGTGYPMGKKGEDIHRFARVAGIVDVFDALTTRRSYKDAIGSFSALKIMKEEVGDHFDEECFCAFVQLLGI
ncbi:MAG: HD-GYP domain-containing protein [Planctomycetota bacterium]|jgi:HD-GYP domain-containing protein (c-di-GMP phosphodiesterase class II)